MFYVYRVRKLVKIVVSEMSKSTDLLNDAQGNPDLQHCLRVFEHSNKRYTPQTARKTLAIATGKKGYLTIANDQASQYSKQQLQVTSEGIVLLTAAGYINALGESVGKISPVVSLTISIAALGVSIWSATHK